MTAHGWRRTSPARAAAAAVRRLEYATPEYRQARAAAKELVESGYGHCWRCWGWIPPGSRWHLGHDDWDRTVIRGPEHERCNLTAAARKGRLVASARRWPL